MNLKYYLRGLGIGIVVTALLMGFTLRDTKEKLSDDEIIARAEQLGMVQSSVLSDDLQQSDKTVSQDAVEIVAATPVSEEERIAEAEKNEDISNPTGAGTENDSSSSITDQKDTAAENNNKETDKTEEDNKEADKKEAEKQEAEKQEAEKQEKDKQEAEADNAAVGKTYTIKVNNGDDSMNVANRLQQMGIIKDAAAFDDYLCKNGYDKHLATGSHTVKAGMSDKELAQALMRSAD